MNAAGDETKQPHAPALGPKYVHRYVTIDQDAKAAAGSVMALARRIHRVASPSVGRPVIAETLRDVAAMRRELSRLERELRQVLQ